MKVERLPSSGETLLAHGYRVDFGGKGSNQAVGCARLGAQATFVGKIGNDSFADMALGMYRDEGLNVRWLRRTGEAPTGVGFILVEGASGKNCIALAPGANDLLTSADILECCEAIDSARVVLTQLEIPVQAAEAALARGRASSAITILNPAPVRPLSSSVLELVDVLTPNETEALVLCGCDPNGAAEPKELGEELIRRGARQVVVTLGEKGALIVTSSSLIHVPAIKVTPVDTTGAGDAFNAGLALALSCGAELEAAVRFAVVTGGLAVTKEGVVPSLPHREEVVQYYRQSGLSVPSWFADLTRQS